MSPLMRYDPSSTYAGTGRERDISFRSGVRTISQGLREKKPLRPIQYPDLCVPGLVSPNDGINQGGYTYSDKNSAPNRSPICRVARTRASTMAGSEAEWPASRMICNSEDRKSTRLNSSHV